MRKTFMKRENKRKTWLRKKFMKRENNVLEQDYLQLTPLPTCLQPACKTPNILHQKSATLLEFVHNSKGTKSTSLGPPVRSNTRPQIGGQVADLTRDTDSTD